MAAWVGTADAAAPGGLWLAGIAQQRLQHFPLTLPLAAFEVCPCEMSERRVAVEAEAVVLEQLERDLQPVLELEALPARAAANVRGSG